MNTIFQFIVLGGIGRIERKVKDTAEEIVQFRFVHLFVLQGFPDMHLFKGAVFVVGIFRTGCSQDTEALRQ